MSEYPDKWPFPPISEEQHRKRAEKDRATALRRLRLDRKAKRKAESDKFGDPQMMRAIRMLIRTKGVPRYPVRSENGRSLWPLDIVARLRLDGKPEPALAEFLEHVGGDLDEWERIVSDINRLKSSHGSRVDAAEAEAATYGKPFRVQPVTNDFYIARAIPKWIGRWKYQQAAAAEEAAGLDDDSGRATEAAPGFADEEQEGMRP